MKLGIFKIFDGMINIEKSYKACDKALSVLKKYNENPDAFKDPEKKEEMEEDVQEALDAANRIIALEGKKNWPGVFREMHKNLGNIYLALGRIEDAKKEIEELKRFGQPGILDAEEIAGKIAEKENSEAVSEK